MLEHIYFCVCTCACTRMCVRVRVGVRVRVRVNECKTRDVEIAFFQSQATLAVLWKLRGVTITLNFLS